MASIPQPTEKTNGKPETNLDRLRLLVDGPMIDLDLMELRAMLVHIRYADPDGIAYPGPDLIAGKIGVEHPRSAKRILSRLKDKGLLVNASGGPGRGNIAKRRIVLNGDPASDTIKHPEKVTRPAQKRCPAGRTNSDPLGAQKVTQAQSPEQVYEQVYEQTTHTGAADAACGVVESLKERFSEPESRKLASKLRALGRGADYVSECIALADLFKSQNRITSTYHRLLRSFLIDPDGADFTPLEKRRALEDDDDDSAPLTDEMAAEFFDCTVEEYRKRCEESLNRDLDKLRQRVQAEARQIVDDLTPERREQCERAARLHSDWRDKVRHAKSDPTAAATLIRAIAAMDRPDWFETRKKEHAEIRNRHASPLTRQDN